MADVTFRFAERDALCSICNGDIKRKVDKMITYYKRPSNVNICPNCVKELYEIVMKDNQ